MSRRQNILNPMNVITGSTIGQVPVKLLFGPQPLAILLVMAEKGGAQA